MKNKNNCKKVILGLAVLSAGATAFASAGLVPPGLSAGDPASPSLTESKLAIQQLVDLQMKLVPHAAAESSGWFQSPSVFGEYGFTDTRDNRLGGFETSMHSVTAGLNFQTKGDVGLGMTVNYGSTSGSTEFPGHITDAADNVGFTLSAMKSFNWFFMGVSGGYDYSDALMVTPVGNRLKTQADSYTVSPFIGAMYVKGNFSFSTVPTLVMRWQDFGYSVNSVSTPGDDSSDVTFVLMNKISFNVTEKLSLAVIANWTCVVNEDASLTSIIAGQTTADNRWITIGPKVNYNFTDKLSAYASYTIDLGTSTYDNQQVAAGLNFNF